MAKPPQRFQSEVPPLPCGATWGGTYIVSGVLPNGKGKEFKRSLPPIAGPLPSMLGWWQNDEITYSNKIKSRIRTIEKQLRDNRSKLDTKQRNAVSWLISAAKAELEKINRTYKKWIERQGGSFSLQYMDVPEAFPHLGEKCMGNEGRTFDKKQGPGRPIGYRCPTNDELEQRPRDRAAIAAAYEDALYNTRCAEFGLWRMVLYAQAKAKYSAPTRRPPGQGGGVIWGGTVQPPPPPGGSPGIGEPEGGYVVPPVDPGPGGGPSGGGGGNGGGGVVELDPKFLPPLFPVDPPDFPVPEDPGPPPNVPIPGDPPTDANPTPPPYPSDGGGGMSSGEAIDRINKAHTRTIWTILGFVGLGLAIDYTRRR